MIKKRMIALLGALTLLVSSGAFPALADKPVTVDGVHVYVIPDTENDVAVFWNITRDGWCDWVSSPPTGPPPALELVPATFDVTGQGAFTLSWRATKHLEIWNVDDPDTVTGDVCTDTDGQAGPWATGEARFTVEANDPFEFRPHNAGVSSGQGTVDAADGRWHYSWTETGEFVDGVSVNTQANYNLRKKGK